VVAPASGSTSIAVPASPWQVNLNAICYGFGFCRISLKVACPCGAWESVLSVIYSQDTKILRQVFLIRILWEQALEDVPVLIGSGDNLWAEGLSAC